MDKVLKVKLICYRLYKVNDCSIRDGCCALSYGHENVREIGTGKFDFGKVLENGEAVGIIVRNVNLRSSNGWREKLDLTGDGEWPR